MTTLEHDTCRRLEKCNTCNSTHRAQKNKCVYTEMKDMQPQIHTFNKNNNLHHIRQICYKEVNEH